MTPKEKARDILEKIEGVLGNSVPTHDDPFYKETIQIGIICVDEILDNERENHTTLGGTYDYWLEVKKEINSL